MKTTFIGNYKLDTLIGSGAFGYVYACSHKLNKKSYALKIDIEDYGIKTIKYEASMLKYLCKVPNVIKLVHYGSINNKQYMVMEMHGLTLEEKLISTKNIKFMEKINYSLQILEILKNIHEKGIIHRDIKPENFLLTMDGRQLILIDFGMAKSYVDNNGSHKKLQKINKLIGSLRYCSINSHNLYELSRRDDIISFVYLMMILFTGSVPWENMCGTREIDKKELIKIRKKISIKDDYDNNIMKKLNHIASYLYDMEYEMKPNYCLIEIHINNMAENT